MSAVLLWAAMRGLSAVSDELADDIVAAPHDDVLRITGLATLWGHVPEFRAATPLRAAEILGLAESVYGQNTDLARRVREYFMAMAVEESSTAPIDRIIAESSGWTPEEEA
ncbi:MAG TPA: hypothetical protein VML95_08600 [Longimicrobiales bacterium]|nr:hypothetical protein [Longimicrobiales bacterium]